MAKNTFPGLLGEMLLQVVLPIDWISEEPIVLQMQHVHRVFRRFRWLLMVYLGDSDLVLAGGADTMNDILMHMCFSKTPALSKSGDCRPFSDKADGTLLGEGIAMFALKRLADAERDGRFHLCPPKKCWFLE